MSLQVNGRLINVEAVPATEAEPAKDGRDARAAREAHIKLEVYDPRARDKENKLIIIKAPLSVEAEMNVLLDEQVNLPVNAYPWAEGKDRAKVAYKLITDSK